MLAALRAAPAAHAQAAIELVSAGLEQAGTDAVRYPLAQALRKMMSLPDAPASQLEGWLAVVERRPVRPAEVLAQSTQPAPAPGPAPDVAPASLAPAPPLPQARPSAPAPAEPGPGAEAAAPATLRTNPAVLVTPPTDTKPAAAVCTGQSPACPGGG